MDERHPLLGKEHQRPPVEASIEGDTKQQIAQREVHQNYANLSVEDIVTKFQTHLESGLTNEEANKRLEENGPNVVA